MFSTPGVSLGRVSCGFIIKDRSHTRSLQHNVDDGLAVLSYCLAVCLRHSLLKKVICSETNPVKSSPSPHDRVS